MSHSFLQLTFMVLIISFTAGCSVELIEDIPQLEGLTQTEVVEEIGEPYKSNQFAMSSVFDEMRIALRNFYPLTNSVNHDVQIREMWWDDGAYWITLWLHQVNGEWFVLDSLRWHKDVQF